jgi:hypothetical protein
LSANNPLFKSSRQSNLDDLPENAPPQIDMGYGHAHTAGMHITLSADEQVVERARKRASVMGKSLNQAMCDYLHHLAGDEDIERNIDDFKSLSGQGDSQGWKFNRDEIHERC